MKSSRALYARSIRRRANRTLALLGLDLVQTRSAFGDMGRLFRAQRAWAEQRRTSSFSRDFPEGQRRYVVGEHRQQAGAASGHYFHQDLLVASEVFKREPARHVDVGSSLSGFVAHVATFREIEVIDIRPLSCQWENIVFRRADITSRDSTHDVAPAESVSCLHALEHFGLGRYGDPINFDGWLWGLQALKELVLPNGTLYLSVPTGRNQRIEFNAHRVFSVPFLETQLLDDFKLHELALVDDSGRLHRQVNIADPAVRECFGSDYGLSIWILEKPNSVADG